MSQLSTDCLYIIFEYLENDQVTLCSCLLVNHLWCAISVKILWRSVWNCSTLIACLPNESKEILCKNGITISTSTSKLPIFNYAAFCKSLSINNVNCKVNQFLRNKPERLCYIVTQEICKLIMKQIPSLKMLEYPSYVQNIQITSYPGAKDCLKNLSELRLRCWSDIYPELFYELSTICHNIQTLNISFEMEKFISNRLTDLISVQQNLKYLTIKGYGKNLANIIPSFPNTLIKFKLIILDKYYLPFSFMNKFTNLQELGLSFNYDHTFEDFKQLQYTTFPQLQILKFNFISPRNELLINFLEINGKNLKEFYVNGDSDDSLNLAIAKFCPNLRKLSTGFRNNELETLEIVFII